MKPPELVVKKMKLTASGFATAVSFIFTRQSLDGFIIFHETWTIFIFEPKYQKKCHQFHTPSRKTRHKIKRRFHCKTVILPDFFPALFVTCLCETFYSFRKFQWNCPCLEKKKCIYAWYFQSWKNKNTSPLKL